jgi:hypothetical protein
MRSHSHNWFEVAAIKAGKKADRQCIMISPVSFLPGDNPDFQGTGIRRALCYAEV